MKQALLISTNQHIIDEFISIATIAKVKLVTTAQPTAEHLQNTQRIFVDHDSDITNFASLIHQWQQADQLETALVMAGAATARSWQVAAEIGAKHIVLIPESRQWLVEYIKSIPRKLAQIVSVASVTGGAGSSTIALAIARASALAGKSVTLVDLDFQSVGLDIAAGCEKLPGLNWTTIQNEAADADGDAIIAALSETSGVRLLTNSELGIQPELALQKRVISEIGANCDLVIIDAGRCLPQETLKDMELTASYFVTPNTIRACAIGREIFTDNQWANQKIIVREIPGSGLNPVMVAQTLDRPLAAVVPTDSRICELSEQGLALSNNPLTKFNRPISALTQQLFGDENVFRAA